MLQSATSAAQLNPDQVSIIIPVCDGGPNWAACLDALERLRPQPYEIIVVDDGSVDDSRERTTARGLKLFRTDRAHSGPALARNLGALQAGGNILFFLDADVLPYPDAVSRVVNAFGDPKISAILGSYDDSPAAQDFVSQYKNLMHHHVHQTSRAEATSFWAGCGAMRRPVFIQLGGFSSTYTRPSIEDIELGHRLRRRGYRIMLVKDLQVKHLKRWSWSSLLRTDIRDRAIPWSELIMHEHEFNADLNLKLSHQLSAVLSLMLPVALAGVVLSSSASGLALAMAICFIALNFDLYYFFFRRRGFIFAFGTVPMHWLYYVYSSCAFAWVVGATFWRNRIPPRRAGSTTRPHNSAR